LKVKKLRPQAIIPTQAYDDPSGIDFYWCPDTKAEIQLITETTRKIKYPLGVAVEFPEGYTLIFKDKSGVANTKAMHVVAGVIESTYRGELEAVFYCHGQEYLQINQGDKIVQGIILPKPKVEISEVDELSETERGDKGFGSSSK
jgi:dUTP pyrophosphatase